MKKKRSLPNRLNEFINDFKIKLAKSRFAFSLIPCMHLIYAQRKK